MAFRRILRALLTLRETIDMLSINGASSLLNVYLTRSNPAVAAKAPSRSLQSPSASSGPSNGVRSTQNRDAVSISALSQDILNQERNSIKRQIQNSAIMQIQNRAKQIMQNDFNQEMSDFSSFQQRLRYATAQLAQPNAMPQNILPLLRG